MKELKALSLSLHHKVWLYWNIDCMTLYIIDKITTMIADGRVLLVELHQSDPQKYSPSSPVPWTWWKWSKIWLGEVMYYSKPLLWLILLWLACQNRPTPQIEVHHMLSESVMAKWMLLCVVIAFITVYQCFMQDLSLGKKHSWDVIFV